MNAQTSFLPKSLAFSIVALDLLPAAAIAVEDSLNTRDNYRGPHDPPVLKDGYRQPGEMFSSSTELIFGRKDRVDLLRPTATNIPINDIQIPFETEPPPEGIALDTIKFSPMTTPLPNHSCPTAITTCVPSGNKGRGTKMPSSPPASSNGPGAKNSSPSSMPSRSSPGCIAPRPRNT